MLHACNGGGGGSNSSIEKVSDGESSSSAPSREVSISGTLGATVTSASVETTFLPQANNGFTRQATAAITTGDLAGSVVVLATDTQGNSYATQCNAMQTDANRKFDLKVPAGKSYVIMFVNGGGQFIGVFVHNTTLKTAAYAMDSNTDIGTISFSPDGKATSDKANEMKSKQDTVAKDLPEKPNEITTEGEKISLLSTFVLPNGSHSYSVTNEIGNKDGFDLDAKTPKPFRHSLSYYSTVTLDGQVYIAQADFTLCFTADKDGACPTKSTDPTPTMGLMLSQVTPQGVQQLYFFNGNIYDKEEEGESAIPLIIDKDKPIQLHFFNDNSNDVSTRVDYVITFNSFEKKTFAGRPHNYLVLKAVITEADQNPSTKYFWNVKNFGDMGDSATSTNLPDGLEGVGREQFLYVYNSDLGDGTKDTYGTKPDWLDGLGVIKNAPGLIKSVIKEATPRYVPDKRQKITVGKKEHPVKGVRAYKNSRGQMNISFSLNDHDSHGYSYLFMNLNPTLASTYKGDKDFRQQLKNAGAKGLTTNVSVYIKTSSTGPAGASMQMEQEVTLTWRNDKDNTFTVTGLSGTVVDNNTASPNTKPIEFGDLIAQWTTSN